MAEDNFDFKETDLWVPEQGISFFSDVEDIDPSIGIQGERFFQSDEVNIPGVGKARFIAEREIKRLGLVWDEQVIAVTEKGVYKGEFGKLLGAYQLFLANIHLRPGDVIGPTYDLCKLEWEGQGLQIEADMERSIEGDIEAPLITTNWRDLKRVGNLKDSKLLVSPNLNVLRQLKFSVSSLG